MLSILYSGHLYYLFQKHYLLYWNHRVDFTVAILINLIIIIVNCFHFGIELFPINFEL